MIEESRTAWRIGNNNVALTKLEYSVFSKQLFLEASDPGPGPNSRIISFRYSKLDGVQIAERRANT